MILYFNGKEVQLEPETCKEYGLKNGQEIPSNIYWDVLRCNVNIMLAKSKDAANKKGKKD